MEDDATQAFDDGDDGNASDSSEDMFADDATQAFGDGEDEEAQAREEAAQRELVGSLAPSRLASWPRKGSLMSSP